MRDCNIALIPADGSGHEVVPKAVTTLAAVARLDGGFRCRFQLFDWGSERYLRIAR